MKSASIFLKDQIYRICPIVRTTEAARKRACFVIFLDFHVAPKELGIKALEALEKSMIIIPSPITKEEKKDYTNNWYSSMKIKSWKSFANGALDVELDLHDNQIEITPSRHGPPKGFFAFLSEKARFCSADDPEVLGQAIIDAFADCE